MKVRLYQVAHEKTRLGTRKCPWSIEWRENGRRRSKTIGAKADAAEFAAVKTAELLDGMKGVTRRKKWGDFVDEYLRDEVEASGKRPRTVSLIRTVLKTFTDRMKPTWVHLIDAKTLDTYRRRRLKDKGNHGNFLSPSTVKKELRHIHAALGTANRWKYLREVPPLPRVAGDEREQRHVTEAHFVALLDACDTAKIKYPARNIHATLPEQTTQGDFWKALLVTCWVTGARIESILRLRWEDLDWATGRVLSRAADLKQRKDTRPEIAAALPYLTKIRGSDPRLLPWNHHRRTLYVQFYAIQKEAGNRPCPARTLAKRGTCVAVRADSTASTPSATPTRG